MHPLELSPRLLPLAVPSPLGKRGSSAIVTLPRGTTTFARVALLPHQPHCPEELWEGAEPCPRGMSVLLCHWNDLECGTVLWNAGVAPDPGENSPTPIVFPSW